ncbi:unnamed protein product, partial [Allacma fusca]
EDYFHGYLLAAFEDSA